MRNIKGLEFIILIFIFALVILLGTPGLGAGTKTAYTRDGVNFISKERVDENIMVGVAKPGDYKEVQVPLTTVVVGGFLEDTSKQTERASSYPNTSKQTENAYSYPTDISKQTETRTVQPFEATQTASASTSNNGDGSILLILYVFLFGLFLFSIRKKNMVLEDKKTSQSIVNTILKWTSKRNRNK